MRLSKGDLDSKVWVIGEAPTKQDVQDGEPFMSYAGKYLKDKLKLYGCSESEIYMDYLIPTPPPRGKWSNVWDDPDARAEAKASIAELKEMIKDCQPNMVICLGAQPLYHLLGLSNIGTWRGHIQWSGELGVKMITTYHPSVAMRQRRVDKKNHPGQYETLFMFDLKKALENSTSHELGFVEYESVVKPSFETAMKYMEDALKDARILSYDIETDSNSVMDCISLCYEQDRCISIPFHIITTDSLVPYWSSTEQAAKVLLLLKLLLESEIPKVAQNSQYDTVFLHKYYNIQVRNLVWDTMVAAHDLYSELPKDLGTLISLYTNLPQTKHLGKKGGIDAHWLYSATDAIANLHVMDGEIKECLDPSMGGGSVRKHYREISHSAIMPCAWMQIEGVNVNQEIRDEAISVESLLQTEIMDALDTVFPKKINGNKKFIHMFNPGSSKDKLFLFDKVLGCKLVTKRNNKTNKTTITFNKNVMSDYMESGHRPTQLFAKAVRDYRLSQTMLGKLKTPLLNGRMHSAYYLGGEDESEDEVGTDTGRLGSRTSIFRVWSDEDGYISAGTNLQNLQKGIQRQMLIPDEGEGFLYLDLWAAEAYITALDAGEPELLAMLNKGIKVHGWFLEETMKKFAKEVKEAGYGYKGAKQGVHANNYGVEPPMMSKESHMPLYVSEWQHAFYHSKFPGIKIRQGRIKNELINERRITSLLGRQKIVIAPMSDRALKQAYAWGSQSVIAEVTLMGMTKMHLIGRHPAYPWCFPALNTHDGLAIRYKLGEEENVLQLAIKAFNIPIKKGDLSITVPISYAFATNFNDMEEERVHRYDT